MPATPNNTICFFACHFKNESIPSYLKLYLSELSKYCTKLIVINEDDTFVKKDSAFIATYHIEPLITPNLGHDFGSWMQGLATINPTQYEHYIFANDSCLLVQPLASFFVWLANSNSDFTGLINSNERKYHVQSYFMVVNANGLEVMQSKFKKHGIIKDKRKLIKYYEVGISQAQLNKKNRVSTLVQVPASNKNNPMFHRTVELIQTEFPLVKKQLVFNQLSQENVVALTSAGVYTGSQVVKGNIEKSSLFKNVKWIDLFKDQPINQ